MPLAFSFEQVDDLTITVRGSDDVDLTEPASKKKKKNRRAVDKDFFIPYQPSDFKRERGYDQSNTSETSESLTVQIGNSFV
jgi:hypothetical protein